MPWRRARSNRRAAESRRSATKRSPAAPCLATIASGSARDSVGITWPLLRPEAPKPGSAASRTTVPMPASARCRAAESPVKPAPITTASQRSSPARAGSSGPGGVTACQSDAGGTEPPGLIAPGLRRGVARARRPSSVAARLGQERRPGRVGGEGRGRHGLLDPAGDVDHVELRAGLAAGIAEEHDVLAVRGP